MLAPEELSTWLLEHLRTKAEAHLGEPVTGAVSEGRGSAGRAAWEPSLLQPLPRLLMHHASLKLTYGHAHQSIASPLLCPAGGHRAGALHGAAAGHHARRC